MPLGRRRVQSDVTYTTQDKGAIVKARIDAQNTRSDTFIGTSAYSFTTGNTITAEYEKGKPETEIIGELCNSLNGIDFQIMPVAVNGDPQMGEARVWANRGSVLTNIAFETGQNGKKNVESFTVVVDPMKVTTDERVTGKEDAESEDQNTDTLDDFGTILDSLDALSDISSQALLDAVRDQLLAWRSTSRRVVTFKPTGSAYLPVRDFNVADYVPVHLEGGRWVGERVITGAVRVHGWELTRDAGGAARLSSVTILPKTRVVRDDQPERVRRGARARRAPRARAARVGLGHRWWWRRCGRGPGQPRRAHRGHVGRA
jgi:hypothetical protein